MRTALVHDWLTNMGGSERVLELIHHLFPDAPVYTLLHDAGQMSAAFKAMDIRTSYLQKLPAAIRRHQWLLPFMPTAIESLDLREYDLVISSSTACAKGVLTRSDCCHICFCNTPMRYAWDFFQDYLRSKPRWLQGYIAHQMHTIRIWDRLSADRVDYFLANSANVRNRIRKHYRREAGVIHPPIDTGFFTPGPAPTRGYFLCAGRLVAYKRIDLAVRACSALDLPLVIAGGGTEYQHLRSLAGPSVQFRGQVSQDELLDLYRGCRALIFPGEEDFGLTPLEAQACGKPVLAYGKGGALETVLPGETGMFFSAQAEEDLRSVLRDFAAREDQFDPDRICRHASSFNIPRFQEEFAAAIQRLYQDFRSGLGT
jgi:glycosyltransferase involved in cell wall biosynthesis